MSTVAELITGDVVALSGDSRKGTFLGRSDHPRYPNLQAVTWWMNDGQWFIDALDARQEIGEVVGRRPVDEICDVLSGVTRNAD